MATSLSSFFIFAFLAGVMIYMAATEKANNICNEEISRLESEKEKLTTLHYALHMIAPEKKLNSKISMALRLLTEREPNSIFACYLCQNNNIEFIAASRSNSIGRVISIPQDDPTIVEICAKIRALTDYESLKQSGGLDKPVIIRQGEIILGQIQPIALITEVFGILVEIGGKQHTERESRFLGEFCDGLALLIDNHRIYNDVRIPKQPVQKQLVQETETKLTFEEETLSAKLFDAMFPSTLPNFAGWGIAKYFFPSANQADFLDIISISSDKQLLLYGKCSGRGLDAALYVSKLKMLFRCFINDSHSPADLLNKLSVYMNSDLMPDLFVDMLAMTFGADNSEIEIAMAGSIIPLINRTRSGYAEIPSLETGIPLGLFNQGTTPYRNQKINIMPGDGILLHTDGITDFPGTNRERISNEDLKNIMDKLPEDDATEMLSSLVRQIIKSHSGETPEEDHSLIYLKAE